MSGNDLYRLCSASPLTRKVYHGSSAPFQGEYLRPSCPEGALVKTKSPVVCAGTSFLHAAAYGFKNLGGATSVNGLSETPVVIVGFDPEDSLDRLMAGKAYVAELSAEDFDQGVFFKEEPGIDIPLEWHSSRETKILNVECFAPAQILEMGVQLFVTDRQILLDNLSIENTVQKAFRCIETKGDWVNRKLGLNPAAWILKQLEPQRVANGSAQSRVPSGNAFTP